jgi:hypothetical protein
VKYISDRQYFSIVLGIVPQLRYNYKLGRRAQCLSVQKLLFV